MWVERNILLRNVWWPRRTRLEVVNYADQQRFPKDKALPALRVRAWKYVIADRAAPLGWRPLTYQDLKERQLVAADVVNIPLPRDFGGWKFDPDDLPPRVPAGLSDQVRLRLGRHNDS